MRITTPKTLSAVTRRPRRQAPRRRSLLQRINAYTLWAFNPQSELRSRYDRAA